jgi:hypothetical protein
MPVQMPRRYDLIVNMGTARALSLALSPELLAEAEEIIE